MVLVKYRVLLTHILYLYPKEGIWQTLCKSRVLKTSPALTRALGLGLGLGYAGADVLFDGNDIYGFMAFVFKAHKTIGSSHLMEQVN